jgi:acetate---CoA ligase (ADP-forming)
MSNHVNPEAAISAERHRLDIVTGVAPADAPPGEPPLPGAGLDLLLSPRSVAVIGASSNPATIGHQIFRNFAGYGYTGVVYPVNPKAKAVASVRAYPTIADVPEPPDMALVVVPKERVIDVATECGEAGVRSLVVISAGFREVGGEGVEREQELARIVRRYGMRMVGPNCMGVLNSDPAVSMNATFATVIPPFGYAAFVSQSGALGVNVLDHAREYGFGISQFVSIGNKADVSGNDLLVAWEHHPAVKVILMYVESFGNPRNFLEIAARITRHKPIIAVKSGRSRAGARAASSHTGALAASDTAVDALLAQAGVMRAGSIEELFDMAMAFGARALPRTRRTAVLTNAGGPGILAADAMETYGLELVELAAATVSELQPLFPTEASLRNPIDMVASARPVDYATALSALLRDPGVDAVLPIFVPPFAIRQEDVAKALVMGAGADASKPVIAVLMGREGLQKGRADLRDAGIPAYTFPESAARALAALNRHRERSEQPPVLPADFEVDRSTAAAIIARARAAGRDRLTTAEALAVIGAYGIPTADARLASNAEAAVSAADAIGYPVALKIQSAHIDHKSDLGGVHVGIESGAALRRIHDEMIERVKRDAPGAHVDGVLVQRMVSGGLETIVGISREPGYERCPLVMFGLGGIFVESIGDVVFGMAPLDRARAEAMVAGIRGATLLSGTRGRAAVDRGALAEALCRIGRLAEDFPEISELDVNPLIALSEGAVAVDARIRI